MKFTVARMTSLKPRTFTKQMNIFIKNTRSRKVLHLVQYQHSCCMTAKPILIIFNATVNEKYIQNR